MEQVNNSSIGVPKCDSPIIPIDDYEVTCYTNAFVASSNRVRYVIVAITIASILVFVGYRNSSSEGWANSRLRLARMALNNQVWLLKPGKTTDKIENARRWAEIKGIRNIDDARDQVRLFDQERLDHVLQLQMPILGIRFDVNDLGFLGGTALAVLMLMLSFAISRQHENLFLSLWKVRSICDREGRKDDGQSKANLVYHTLAMAQHFNKPPTLARWERQPWNNLSRLLLLLPISAQGLMLWNDWQTREVGRMLNAYWASRTLFLEATYFGVVLFLAIYCYIYMRVSDRRWRKIFRYINPKRYEERQPRWSQWVGLPWAKLRRGSEVVIKGNVAPSASPPQPAAELVPVSIESEPAGADVYLDGAFVGSTPLIGYGISAGEHALDVERAGLPKWTRKLLIRANVPTHVRAYDGTV